MPGVSAAVGVVPGSLSPLRRRVLEELREPASAVTLAARLGESRQRVNYHVRALERGGLVELVEERRRRGCTERIVRATARAVVVDPDAVGDLDTVARTQDRFAADALLAQAARTVSSVAGMRERAEAQGRRLATFAIEADVAFGRPEDIERFADALAGRVAELAAEFDTEGGRRYRVVAGGHPAPRTVEET
jgi:DNA-binding transcriptional ArsR family regulator